MSNRRFPQTHAAATPASIREAEITLMTPWRALLEPYVRNMDLFRCPSDWGAPRLHPTTYAPNGYTLYGASLAQVATPSRMIYATELEASTLLDDFSPWWGAQALAPHLAVGRHGGGAVYLFVDGHTRWLRFEQTWSPADRHKRAG